MDVHLNSTGLFQVRVVLYFSDDEGVFSGVQVRIENVVIFAGNPFLVETFQHIFVRRLFQRIDIVVRCKSENQIILIIGQLYLPGEGQSGGQHLVGIAGGNLFVVDEQVGKIQLVIFGGVEQLLFEESCHAIAAADEYFPVFADQDSATDVYA